VAARTQKKTKKATLATLVRIESDETFADLERKLIGAKSLQRNPTAVRLEDILIANKVFQWRRREYSLIPSADHVLGLAKALETSRRPLEPILVLPVAGDFYVIDGHHRVEAYHSVKWTKLVPVEIFRGSLAEARIEGLRRNNKDKLPMSKQSKMEATWTLVKEDDLSAEKARDITGTSVRQIYYMRSVWKELRELPEEQRSQLKDGIEGLTWTQARTALAGEPPEYDDDWKAKEAQKIVDALLRTKIGLGLIKHPEITAIALARLHEGLPSALVSEWFSADELREMAGDVGEYEF
jgi:hypothetical protein